TRVPFTEDMTLLTAINAAGGFNDFADQKRVRLLRGTQVTVFDVRKFRKDPSLDVKLQPGDKVEVPQSLFYGRRHGRTAADVTDPQSFVIILSQFDTRLLGRLFLYSKLRQVGNSFLSRTSCSLVDRK